MFGIKTNQMNAMPSSKPQLAQVKGTNYKMCSLLHYISLGDVEESANFVCFMGLLPLLPHLCPLSVLYGGGGYGGYIQKALEKGYSKHPRFACCTDNMFEIFVPFGRCLCCSLPRFVDRQPPCLHINSPHVLLLPLMHRKSHWWLDFGSTPDPVNLQPHAGCVWLKSGYDEAIP